MTALNKEKVVNALEKLNISSGKKDIVAADLVSSIIVEGDKVGFVIELPDEKKEEGERIRQSCEDAVRSIPEVKTVTAVLTAEIANNNREDIKNNDSVRPRPPTPKAIKGIKNIIAVASGKGGVGKSTVSVNLAISLAEKGMKVGLVDADIYGPSIAKMTGINSEPEVKDSRLIPIERFDIKILSMGMLLKEDVPVVWRGPMISKALKQLMLGANWGELDVLIMDLPPGTGDIHLSIAQNFAINGAVLVSTPQQVSVLDVKKALGMFKKVDIPVLGIVDNMQYFQDNGGIKHMIFGPSSVADFAKASNIKFLGALPLDPNISRLSDSGKPALVENKEGEMAKIMSNVSKNILENLKY